MWCWRSSFSISPAFWRPTRPAPAQQRRRGLGRWAGHHRRPVPPALPAADAGVSLRLRRQRRRADAEAARHRPADRPADDRGGDRARRSRAARHHARPTRKCASGSRSLPAFQENGHFIGEERYRQLLQMQNPPMRPDGVRGTGAPRRRRSRSCRRRSPTGSRSATRRSTHEYRRRNEKVKLAVVAFPADKFRRGPRSRPTPSSPRTSTRTRTSCKIPEKRKVRVRRWSTCRRSASGCRSRPQDIERSYKDNQQQYSTPGAGARQPHPAEDRRQGRSGGEEAGGGAAEKVKARRPTSPQLATKYSEDDSSKAKGGDLDYFAQGTDGAGVRRGRLRAEPGRSATS